MVLTQTGAPPIWASRKGWNTGKWLAASLFLAFACSQSMKLLQVNCSGFTRELNLQLARYVEDKKVEVICLQETFAKDRSTTFKNWLPYLRPSSDGYGGVAIFVSPTLKSAPCDSLLDNNLEAVWTQIQIAGKVTTVGSVYIRPGQVDKVATLQSKISTINTPLIIMGDLNGHSNLWDSNYTQRKLDTARKMGIKIENLIIEENLNLRNTGQYTFVHRRDGGTWALDLTLTRNIVAEARWSSDHFNTLKTDHCPTLLQVEESVRHFRKQKWDIYMPLGLSGPNHWKGKYLAK